MNKHKLKCEPDTTGQTHRAEGEYLIPKEPGELPTASVTDNGGLIKSCEERVAEARKFNLLSNVFMSVALNDPLACQHVIRILTGIKDLKVKEIRTQYRISQITSHDAILDVLAEDREGNLINLEIQRKDTVDHARRTRFYGSMIDSTYLEKGREYNEMPEVHIIYISETDLWRAGRTSYPVKKHFAGTDVTYDDGIHVLYVNAAVDDGTDTAKMMKYFKKADPEDMSQGDLSRRIHFLKREEGGFEVMCQITEKFLQEGRQEGRQEQARETVLNLAEMGMPVEKIAAAVKVSVALAKQWLEGAASAKY